MTTRSPHKVYTIEEEFNKFSEKELIGGDDKIANPSKIPNSTKFVNPTNSTSTQIAQTENSTRIFIDNNNQKNNSNTKNNNKCCDGENNDKIHSSSPVIQKEDFDEEKKFSPEHLFTSSNNNSPPPKVVSSSPALCDSSSSCSSHEGTSSSSSSSSSAASTSSKDNDDEGESGKGRKKDCCVHCFEKDGEKVVGKEEAVGDVEKMKRREMKKSTSHVDDHQLLEDWPARPDAKWKVRTVGLLAAILPGIGCYLCLLYTFTLQHERVANFTIPSTSCPGLKSIFPPVSYSIGVWKPQKYIWLMVLALHLPPRFFYAIVYKNHYSLGDSVYRDRRWFRTIVRLHYFLLVAEALGLTAVSVIDIESHFKVHAVCFALWLVPFNLNMLFNNLLHFHSGIRKIRPLHDRVFQIKCVLFLVGYPVSLSTGISYLSFVLTCSTIPYAIFSLAEYVLIGVNSIFYFLLIWEFDGSKVEVYVKHRNHLHSHHPHNQQKHKSAVEVGSGGGGNGRKAKSREEKGGNV